MCALTSALDRRTPIARVDFMRNACRRDGQPTHRRRPRSPHCPAQQTRQLGRLFLFAQFVLSELTAIYANHDEGKLTLPGFLDALMRSYEGREAQLLKQV